MKVKFNTIILFSTLMLVFSGCTKPEAKQTVKPFQHIPIEVAKRIEFSNDTITSSENESGRSKMVTEKEKSYIYSIGVSKNQIYVYKYNGDETTKFVYKYTDKKVLEELRKLYNSMNYKEDLLMKK